MTNFVIVIFHYGEDTKEKLKKCNSSILLRLIFHLEPYQSFVAGKNRGFLENYHCCEEKGQKCEQNRCSLT